MSNPLQILIAEDEFLVRMGIKEYVEQLGHVVIAEATDGEEAVRYALEKIPDLIIMDINMPKIDGIDAVKKIKEKTNIPIIIVSGYHDEKLVNRATEEGVLYYLLKPIDISDLKIAIKISLSKFKEIDKLKNELKETKNALDARKHIEKAKGILMNRNNLSEAEAMKVLQKISRDKNKKILVVSQEIIQADSLFL